MSLRKMATAVLLGCLWMTTAFAGVEDWDGIFFVRYASGDTLIVTHTPTLVRFLSYMTGHCLYSPDGMTINGVKVKETFRFCTDYDIPTFLNEVQKLGTIENKAIAVGSTYPR